MRRAKPIVFLLGLAPALWLAWGAWKDMLGVNPIESITRSTGDWTLRFLLLTLAITPLRRIRGWHDLITFRRMLGLWAFFYGCLHLMTWVWLDRFFDVHEMWKDLTKRRFIMAGMTAFAVMIPLAFTSTRGWIRRLGRNWTKLHRLVYLAGAAGVIHYWWLVKSDIRLPLLYGVLLTILLAARLKGPLSRQAVSADQ